MKTAAPEKKQLALLHQLFYDIWNEGKLEFFDDVFAKELVVHVGDQAFEGRESWLDVVVSWRTAFPNMKYEILDVIHAEEKVIARWNAEGTHLGPFYGLMPTKHKVAYDGITIFHVSQGRFDEAWVNSNFYKIKESLKLKSTKTYTRKDFVEDFSGPAAKIYEFVMKARSIPACKQVMVDVLRDHYQQGPPDGKAALIIPKELFNQVDVTEKFIPSGDGHAIRSLVYTPKNLNNSAPVIMYFHGGGWSIGSPETSDLVARKLCSTSRSIVISVDYRLAPEHPFPVGLEDCVIYYEWVQKNALKIHGDASKIFVCGDSCGGNLALALAIKARDEKKELPAGIIAICPLTDFVFENYASCLEIAPNSLIYDFAFLSYVRSVYIPFDKWQHPYASPMYDSLKNLPPVFLLAAGKDPLIDDNTVFAEKLKRAGVPCELLVHEEMPHAYYYFLGLTKEEDQAYQAIAKFLKRNS